MIGWLRIGWVTVSIGLVTLALLPFQLLFLGLGLPLKRRLPRCWHRACCFLIGIRVHVHGAPDGRRPLLLSANHVSWKDILILGSIADVTFVAKSEVKSWPVFGVLARLQETIFVVREEKRRVGHQANEIALRLAAGEIVVLFPEGTTSDGNRLMEIKSSLFGAAGSAVPHSPTGMVHIQPVAIAYTGIQGMAMGRYHRPLAAWPGDITMLPHLIGILREGAIEVDVVFGQPVDVDAQSRRKDISREVESRMRSLLGRRLRGR
ncbi:lysophospholipid acyltransferase family protein [Pararhizobium sp.]|uniref:lysophospholipid acyltransferase family protein n=1 Tax=Pararhizobium sp. TaxID=1977563 RepID=UPI0027175001|nr:lysophospholipid acyltransferase family protein [Pararhizobium sp.]MDO9417737.1 lysophospholipid acyltransferase family protein [Pararhizobium sp.]